MGFIVSGTTLLRITCIVKIDNTLVRDLPQSSIAVSRGVENGLSVQSGQIAHTSVKRHVKTRSAATPYDPQFDAYLAKHKQKKQVGTLGNKCRLTDMSDSGVG